MNFIALDYFDIALAAALVLVNAGLSLRLSLGLERRFLIAAIRMAAQLTLVGLVLKALFAVATPWLTGLAALVMVGFAGYEVMARQERRYLGWLSYGLGTSAMMTAALLVTVFGLATQVRPDPWYDPRYAIPILGMILGNTMTGVALALHTLTQGAVRDRAAIEARRDMARGAAPDRAGYAAYRLDPDHQLHVGDRTGIIARDDDRPSPVGRRSDRSGQISVADQFPDRRRHRVGRAGGSAGRHPPAMRQPPPAAPRSIGVAARLGSHGCKAFAQHAATAYSLNPWPLSQNRNKQAGEPWASAAVPMWYMTDSPTRSTFCCRFGRRHSAFP